jgi:thermitase
MLDNNRFVEGTWKGKTAQFRPDRLILSVRHGDPSVTLRAITHSLGSQVENPRLIQPPQGQWGIVEFQPVHDAERQIPVLAARLSENPALRYAEPDFICFGHGWPNDPDLPTDQWWVGKISLERLWRHARGGKNVYVAIVDSGISINAANEADHEDFNVHRFITAHIRSGVAIDHNYVDPPHPRDDSGHGTNIAGIIAASTNNRLGVAGANWVSRAYVARVLNTWDKVPEGSLGNVKLAVSESVAYADPGPPPPAGSGKRLVVNLSLGAPVDIEIDSLREMCEETATGQILICVAAGSRGASMTDIDYPAAYAADFSHVIAVGATDETDSIYEPILDDYSKVTIFAPGTNIYSTTPTYPTFHFDGVSPCYGSLSGSSQACAIVSGVASVLWGAARTLKADQLKSGILTHALQVARGTHEDLYPRLDLSWLPGRLAPGHRIEL